MYYNKDAFRKAGLDPEKPPVTWPEFFEVAKKLKASGMGVALPPLDQLDSTRKLLCVAQPPLRDPKQRFDGLDTQLVFNSPSMSAISRISTISQKPAYSSMVVVRIRPTRSSLPVA